ncbi:hypothetical protein [Lysobacter antibioticus]|jgi:hypothetical protein|uniref:Uncharacterized protein n=1 Tax=Lysobacter antibioticus TaxID=84531 RepID=A0A0S2FBM4_LYSAN|nr:hypothetical protein [Lysobacter antibioticus]ALN80951.1 hypothetical protein LA76x_2821 [Lysobacter antibioticus]
MSGYPRSPKLLRGGLVLLDPVSGNVLRIIGLQYNPDSMTRSLQIKGIGGESGDRSEALRLKGPPAETIKLEAEIDASDALEAGQVSSTLNGLHPQIAAIEALVHPASGDLFAANAIAATGSLEIAPALAPLSVFVFGPNRIAPVRITELSITEEAFDVSLNPIRAKLSLGLRVLSIDDIGFDSKGGGLFMSYLLSKERFAAQAIGADFRALGIPGVF